MAFEVQSRDLRRHRREQSEIARVGRRDRASQDVPAAAVDAERREADRAAAERREHVLREAVSLRHFRHRERVVRTRVGREHVIHEPGIVAVDVGRDEVDRRRQLSPEPHVLLDGAAARVLDARQREAPLRQLRRRIAQPDVDVDGDGELALPRLGNLVDVSRLVIQLEDLVGVVAERLLPRAAWFLRGRQEIRRHRLREERVGLGREVAHAADVSGLVLDLHHQHCVVGVVYRLEMAHQRREGRLVGVERRSSRSA